MNTQPTVEAVVSLLAKRGIRLPPGNVRLDCYGDSPALSKSLIEMIRSGRKRAGTGLLWLHEHERVPHASAGDIEIVLTHDHEPSVVTRLLSVDVVPYSSVTPEYAAIEGEGDGSLACWREAHWAYFTRVCHAIGREPDESMLVVCSTFEVLHVL